MKNILFLLILILSFNQSFSQDLIAVQNGGTPTFYDDLSDAIQGAVAGDTLYIPGRNYIVNDTINKPLHLIGTGINPNFTQATGMTTVTSSSIALPQLVLGDNADGGSITGIHFTTNNYNSFGSPYNNLTLEFNAEISNFLIERCYFGSNINGINGNFSNSMMKQNIFNSIIINAQNGNTILTNNIFCDRSNRFTNWLG